MNILIFSIFLITIILLIKYFRSTENNAGLKLLTVFGIIIGVLALGLNFICTSCFGASTPIDIKTENLTEQNLKIYAIAFWDKTWNGNGNYVNYDKELKPNETSKFCIDNDGGEFWLVAKNDKNEIKYLQVISKNENNFIFKITANQNVEIEKAHMANELTFKTDQSASMEKYLLWTNIILIGFLITSLIKITTAGNRGYA